jgi:hypothetical protein
MAVKQGRRGWMAVGRGWRETCGGQSYLLRGSGWLILNLSYMEWDIQVHLMSELLQKLNVVFVINGGVLKLQTDCP